MNLLEFNLFPKTIKKETEHIYKYQYFWS